MKKKITVLLLFLFLLIGFVAYRMHWADMNREMSGRATQRGALSSSVPSPSLVQQAPGTSNSQSFTTNSLQAQMDLLFLTPISLYGRVQDEAGKAIAGANINVSYANSMMTMGVHPSENIKSDSNGMFHASGHGMGVVVSVSKEGYYSGRAARGSFTYAREAGTINGHTDPRAPAIFELRKMGAIDSATKSVKRTVHMKQDGTVVGVDIGSGAIVTGTTHGIEVREWLEAGNHAGGGNVKYDWRATVSVPNGGIQVRKGKYDFEAPISGYEPSVDIVMNKDDSSWNDQVTNDYFLSFPDGSYARISLTLTAPGGGFNYRGFFNPASRNLEYGIPSPGASP